MTRFTLLTGLLLSLLPLSLQAQEKTLYLHYSTADGPGGCSLTIDRQEDGASVADGNGCSEDAQALCQSDAKAAACVCGKKDDKVKWKVSKESSVGDDVTFTVRFTAPADATGQAFSPFKNENQCGAVITFNNSQNCTLGDFAYFDNLAFEYQLEAGNGVAPGQPGAIHCIADPRIVIEH